MTFLKHCYDPYRDDVCHSKEGGKTSSKLGQEMRILTSSLVSRAIEAEASPNKATRNGVVDLGCDAAYHVEGGVSEFVD